MDRRVPLRNWSHAKWSNRHTQSLDFPRNLETFSCCTKIPLTETRVTWNFGQQWRRHGRLRSAVGFAQNLWDFFLVGGGKGYVVWWREHGNVARRTPCLWRLFFARRKLFTWKCRCALSIRESWLRHFRLKHGPLFFILTGRDLTDCFGSGKAGTFGWRHVHVFSDELLKSVSTTLVCNTIRLQRMPFYASFRI